MTKDELAQRVKELETQVGEYQVVAAEAVQLRDRCFDLDKQVTELTAMLGKLKGPEAFTSLAKGWMKSEIGKRANDNPKIDLTGFHLGVTRNDFELIQIAYANILETLKADGQPATPAEQRQIGILLKTLGFA
jgi:hypothetical protein